MELWMKIGSALLLGTMIVMLWPQAKRMMRESRKAEAGEWRSAIIPVLLVMLFVAFLIMSVRN